MVYVFAPDQPLDLTTYTPPAADDRTGPPLSRGSLTVLLATVAGADLSPETRATLRKVDPDAWYHGQLLETVLRELEAKNPALPELMGRNIYFMSRGLFEALGLTTASAVIQALPRFWFEGTRGDGGVFRVEMLGERHARVEAEQPYNCLFEMGAVRGCCESFDAYDVEIEHRGCMRKGQPFCTFEVRWKE